MPKELANRNPTQKLDEKAKKRARYAEKKGKHERDLQRDTQLENENKNQIYIAQVAKPRIARKPERNLQNDRQPNPKRRRKENELNENPIYLAQVVEPHIAKAQVFEASIAESLPEKPVFENLSDSISFLTREEVPTEDTFGELVFYTPITTLPVQKKKRANSKVIETEPMPDPQPQQAEVIETEPMPDPQPQQTDELMVEDHSQAPDVLMEAEDYSQALIEPCLSTFQKSQSSLRKVWVIKNTAITISQNTRDGSKETITETELSRRKLLPILVIPGTGMVVDENYTGDAKEEIDEDKLLSRLNKCRVALGTTDIVDQHYPGPSQVISRTTLNSKKAALNSRKANQAMREQQPNPSPHDFFNHPNPFEEIWVIKNTAIVVSGKSTSFRERITNSELNRRKSLPIRVMPGTGMTVDENYTGEIEIIEEDELLKRLSLYRVASGTATIVDQHYLDTTEIISRATLKKRKAYQDQDKEEMREEKKRMNPFPSQFPSERVYHPNNYAEVQLPLNNRQQPNAIPFYQNPSPHAFFNHPYLLNLPPNANTVRIAPPQAQLRHKG